MSDAVSVWIVEDDRSMRWVLERALRQHGMEVESFETAETALDILEHRQPDVIVTDIRMPGMDGLAMMRRIHEQHPGLPVIVMTAHSDLDSAVSSYQGGAFEYLPKPFDMDEAAQLVERASAARHDARRPAGGRGDETTEMVGESPAMQEVFRAIGRLSRSDITVLITGESGTGKELVARALHRHGPRADEPFIALNTAAIPRDLLESELFGHERGAFTGAQSQRRGRFEQAHGGTLFLDEIGDMPADLQTRLLRVLAEGQFYRVGGHTPLSVDVRIIAATHQDLSRAVRDGRFREDLYHRLNVVRIHVPALRERRADLPALFRHFLARAARELEVEPKSLRPDVERYLCSLAWPGNVRELENLCRRLTVMASGREIHMGDLPGELRPDGEGGSGERDRDWPAALRRWAEAELAGPAPAETGAGQGLVDRALPLFERILMETALERTGGRRQEAARLLGWGRNTLTRKLKEHGDPPRNRDTAG